MNGVIIKLRYGLTIDENNQCDEPCPKCGAAVCHVKENNSDVFCTSSLCSFHDKFDYTWYPWIIERIERDASYGIPILFNHNSRYPSCKQPVMLNEDFKKHKYIIRELTIDEQKYSIAKYRGGSKSSCIDVNSPIIARYANLELLVKDNWVSYHDIEID